MILYVTNAIDTNIGACMHKRVINELCKEQKVFTVFLNHTLKYEKQDNYISYGKYKNKTERIRRWLQGNMMFISNGIIDEFTFDNWI